MPAKRGVRRACARAAGVWICVGESVGCTRNEFRWGWTIGLLRGTVPNTDQGELESRNSEELGAWRLGREGVHSDEDNRGLDCRVPRTSRSMDMRMSLVH